MQRLIQDLKSGDFKKIYLLYGQEASYANSIRTS